MGKCSSIVCWNWPIYLNFLSGVISPLISSSMLGTYQPGEFTFQCLIFLPFLPFMGFSRQEHWSGLPFPSPVDNILSEFSTITRLSWVALHSMAHSFIELEKVVAHVIKFVSFLWLWFLSACPYSVPTILLGFLWPWTWGISSRTPLLTLNVGYLLLAICCSLL